jgi:hypothetical protein
MVLRLQRDHRIGVSSRAPPCDDFVIPDDQRFSRVAMRSVRPREPPSSADASFRRSISPAPPLVAVRSSALTRVAPISEGSPDSANTKMCPTWPQLACRTCYGADRWQLIIGREQRQVLIENCHYLPRFNKPASMRWDTHDHASVILVEHFGGSKIKCLHGSANKGATNYAAGVRAYCRSQIMYGWLGMSLWRRHHEQNYQRQNPRLHCFLSLGVPANVSTPLSVPRTLRTAAPEALTSSRSML